MFHQLFVECMSTNIFYVLEKVECYIVIGPSLRCLSVCVCVYQAGCQRVCVDIWLKFSQGRLRAQTQLCIITSSEQSIGTTLEVRSLQIHLSVCCYESIVPFHGFTHVFHEFPSLNDAPEMSLSLILEANRYIGKIVVFSVFFKWITSKYTSLTQLKTDFLSLTLLKTATAAIIKS